ncbi:ABC transporter [Nocardiopsis sp. MG754419]|uniref:ABC transporter n=1 Tax=Nocardiopsis sp. MG754419 TaxID=2259865 RepID=UPI001BA6A230|nr:ABC transporter [Nocardiopsis sp. MG754419]MBR8744183.1 ABC transporter [Nocardiopsis sp. MG754419]
MNGTLYRLETTRLLRTHTLLLLVAAFAAFGVVAPVLTFFMEDLLGLADPGGDLAAMDLEIPPMSAADALGSYVEFVMPLGVLLVVLVATASLTVDASPGRSVFYRSRVARMADLILPRVVVPAAAAFVAHLVGVTVAWSLTSLLFDPAPPPATLAGAVPGGLYLAFVVGVVALASTVVRSALATVGLSIGVLVVVAGIGAIPALDAWSTGALVRAVLLPSTGGAFADLAPAAALTAVLTVAAVALSIVRSSAREV